MGYKDVHNAFLNTLTIRMPSHVFRYFSTIGTAFPLVPSRNDPGSFQQHMLVISLRLVDIFQQNRVSALKFSRTES